MTDPREPPGPPATGDQALAAAIGRLRETLAAANELYATSEDDRRLAVIESLNAAYEFVQSVALHRGAPELMPLVALVAALADLDRGVTAPLFRPKHLDGGHPPDPGEREVSKAVAGATMTLLMQVGGLGREEAARRVAKSLRQAGIMLDGQRQLRWQTVANWRDQMTKACRSAGPENLAPTVYRGILACAPQVLDDPRWRAHCCDDLLAKLRSTIADYG